MIDIVVRERETCLTKRGIRSGTVSFAKGSAVWVTSPTGLVDMFDYAGPSLAPDALVSMLHKFIGATDREGREAVKEIIGHMGKGGSLALFRG